MGLLRKTHTWSAVFITSRQGHMLSTWMIMVGHLAEAVCQISPRLFTSLPYCPLWKEVSMHSPYLRGWKSCSVSWREEHEHKLFGILLHGTFVCSVHLVVYLSNHLFVSVQTHGYLLRTLGYSSTTVFIFLLSQLWPGRAFSCLLGPFDIPHCCVFFCLNTYY